MTDTKATQRTIIQIATGTKANGAHTTIITLCDDNTIWGIVNYGTGDYAGQWSTWEKLPPLPVTTMNSQEE